MKPFRFLLFTLLAALASCSDGIEDVAPAITSYTGLALAVPQVTVSSASKTMNATDEECQAQDLYLFCFPVEGKGGHPLFQDLTKLPVQTDLNGDASLYNIILQPGTYHVYVVANMENNSIWMDDNGTQKLFKDLTKEQLQALTEEQLKALTLSYDATTLPTAGNIPMVYSDKNVVVYNGKATEVAANLTFTCAKVVVNIIFDPDNDAITAQQPKAAEVFKNGINWLLTSVKGNNLTESTNLFTAPATSGDGALSGVTLPPGKFYDGYTYTEANKNVTNADVVTPSGTAVATMTDALTNARKWLYRATYYLPERSVTKEADATALPVTGTITGGQKYTNTYYNISGKNLSTESTENNTNYFKLERGHYYEIVSFVNGLGQYDLPTMVNVKDWETVNISADFLHTTLWVEKTAASIGSLTKDSVEYTTNAIKGITYGCVTQVDSKDVVSITESKDGKKLIFSINPDIPLKTFEVNKAATDGTAKVWIQAGNIKKYIDVSYNVTPFLTVTPVKEVIYWNDDDKTERQKVIKFKTNLGGIKFQSSDFSSSSFNEDKGGSHTFGQSTITVNCTSTSNKVAEGTITVTATSNPESTTDHTFKVFPFTSGHDDLAKEVLVSVHPPKGNYRIYMRAINDVQEYDVGKNIANEWMQDNLLKEDNTKLSTTDNGNWRDGWYTGTWDNKAHPENHYAYIYTQIGETKTEADKDKKPTWKYTKDFPGDQLTADGNNPGWYYIDEAEGKKYVTKENTSDDDDRKMAPGQTLIIFSNNTNTGPGYTLHRFTHHLDPGIPLFNFDDNEGWYLYDPLCDPYYRVFDDKPKVEDITYVIYTKTAVTGWYHYYGVNNSNPSSSDQFKVFREHVDSEKYGDWYMTKLTFKCPHGFYDKAIRLKLNGDPNDPVLFGGASWAPTTDYTITGYYDGSWHEGKPKGVAARRRR